MSLVLDSRACQASCGIKINCTFSACTDSHNPSMLLHSSTSSFWRISKVCWLGTISHYFCSYMYVNYLNISMIYVDILFVFFWETLPKSHQCIGFRTFSLSARRKKTSLTWSLEREEANVLPPLCRGRRGMELNRRPEWLGPYVLSLILG